METRRRRSPLRILAPVALIAFGVALALIVSSSDTNRGGGGPSSNAAEKARDLGSTTRSSRRTHRTRDRLPQKIYVVKTGDTLGSIAEDTGVPVEKLQELNPDLDQFSLVAGQKIKLR